MYSTHKVDRSGNYSKRMTLSQKETLFGFLVATYIAVADKLVAVVSLKDSMRANATALQGVRVLVAGSLDIPITTVDVKLPMSKIGAVVEIKLSRSTEATFKWEVTAEWRSRCKAHTAIAVVGEASIAFAV